MRNVRHIHRFMAERRRILLADGRVGRIVRIDTCFPVHNSQVSVWVQTEHGGPGVARVRAACIVGEAPAIAS